MSLPVVSRIEQTRFPADMLATIATRRQRSGQWPHAGAAMNVRPQHELGVATDHPAHKCKAETAPGWTCNRTLLLSLVSKHRSP